MRNMDAPGGGEVVMGEVIDLGKAKAALTKQATAHARYAEAVVRTRAMLESFAQRIATAGIDLATAGPWREWSDAQPVGTVFQFGPDQIADCGDKHAAALVDLSDRVGEILAGLETVVVPKASAPWPSAPGYGPSKPVIIDDDSFDALLVNAEWPVRPLPEPADPRERGRAPLSVFRAVYGTSVIVSLMPKGELAGVGHGDLLERAAQAGWTCIDLPASKDRLPEDRRLAENAIDEVARALAAGRGVTVLSGSDPSRGAAFAAAVLVRSGLTPVEALKRVLDAQPGVALSPAQARFIGSAVGQGRIADV